MQPSKNVMQYLALKPLILRRWSCLFLMSQRTKKHIVKFFRGNLISDLAQILSKFNRTDIVQTYSMTLFWIKASIKHLFKDKKINALTGLEWNGTMKTARNFLNLTPKARDKENTQASLTFLEVSWLKLKNGCVSILASLKKQLKNQRKGHALWSLKSIFAPLGLNYSKD